MRTCKNQFVDISRIRNNWLQDHVMLILVYFHYAEEVFSAMGNSILTNGSRVFKVKTRCGGMKAQNVGRGESIIMPETYDS